jgi:serine/threonine protein kinase
MSLKRTSELVVGGCRLGEVLGRGGMGTVYRAWQMALGREVAVKVVPLIGGDESHVSRFQREAQMAAGLEHPHTIPVYAAGEENDLLYIVMRLVDGPDLRTLIQREGALAPARAVAMIEQVAEALDAAHEAGLVHRDVKPANVLVEARDGADHAYLSDFGLVRSVTGSTALTVTGQWLGTLDFISPEQLEGEHVDHRADIYALACVLYTCLAGELPFPRDSAASTAWAHVHAPPPRLDEGPIPAGMTTSAARVLTAVISHGMAKRPDDRYTTAGELARAARAALERPPAPTEQPTRVHSRPARIARTPTALTRRSTGSPGISTEEFIRARSRKRSYALVALLCVAGAIAAPFAFTRSPSPHHAARAKPVPPPFSHYSGAGYGIAYPAGWHIVEAERPIATFFRTEFASTDGQQRIIVDRSPGDALTPRAKGLSVESATAPTPGYRRVAFFSTTLRGRQALVWEFVLTGQQRGARVDIFQHLGGSGYAVLGEAPTLASILSVTQRVAASLAPR